MPARDINYSGLSINDINYYFRLMGRPKLWSEESTQARFAKGTFKRIEAVLKEREERTDFVRGAVERELKRREGELDRAQGAPITGAFDIRISE